MTMTNTNNEAVAKEGFFLCTSKWGHNKKEMAMDQALRPKSLSPGMCKECARKNRDELTMQRAMALGSTLVKSQTGQAKHSGATKRLTYSVTAYTQCMIDTVQTYEEMSITDILERALNLLVAELGPDTAVIVQAMWKKKLRLAGAIVEEAITADPEKRMNEAHHGHGVTS